MKRYMKVILAVVMLVAIFATPALAREKHNFLFDLSPSSGGSASEFNGPNPKNDNDQFSVVTTSNSDFESGASLFYRIRKGGTIDSTIVSGKKYVSSNGTVNISLTTYCAAGMSLYLEGTAEGGDVEVDGRWNS